MISFEKIKNQNFESMQNPTRVLSKQLLSISFLNLFLVALSGLWLRSYPFVDYSLSFRNVLHAHSHFAFGGWVMPVLVSLMLRYIPFLSRNINYKHWKNLSILLVGSSYGMLLTFPLGGYYLFSIVFSTLSVLSGFYLSWLIFMACKGKPVSPAVLFLKWAMVYGILSSFGPFLTGPLIALGYQGSPVYFNAIYFYLHFQYNGLFTFMVLAILYSRIFNNEIGYNGMKVFYLMNSALIPCFALSLLWNRPPVWMNFMGGFAALMQLAGFYFLWKDYRRSVAAKKLNLLFMVFVALAMKLVLQLASAFPVIVALAAEQRNFIISYLHLVLLGFITMFVFSLLWPVVKFSFKRKAGFYIFLSGFIITEILMVTQASFGLFTIPFPYFAELVFGFSFLLPLGIFLFSVKEVSQSTRRTAEYTEKFIYSNSFPPSSV